MCTRQEVCDLDLLSYVAFVRAFLRCFVLLIGTRAEWQPILNEVPAADLVIHLPPLWSWTPERPRPSFGIIAKAGLWSSDTHASLRQMLARPPDPPEVHANVCHDSNIPERRVVRLLRCVAIVSLFFPKFIKFLMQLCKNFF